jgi:IS1 family transposase
MNQLPLSKRAEIIRLLVEGNSMRAASRIADVSITTVSKLLVSVGKACQKFHDENVKGLTSERIQCDEIWSFVYAKEKNKPEGMEDGGDTWTFVAIDAETKLVVSWLIGTRNTEVATVFMHDIARRVNNKVQLTTDGFNPYKEAVNIAFPTDSEIDYAQLVKLYGPDTGTNSTERKYSPARCTGIRKEVVFGTPAERFISTSYVERQNLTMRMHMRRFTRLTNAFSKKLENHSYAIALHFVYYNWVKQHKTLRITPAMAAGLTKRFMTIEDIVQMA